MSARSWPISCGLPRTAGRRCGLADVATITCRALVRTQTLRRSGLGRRLRGVVTGCGVRTRRHGSRASPRPGARRQRTLPGSWLSGSKGCCTGAAWLVNRSSARSPDLESEQRLDARARALAEGVHELHLGAQVAIGAGRASASLGWAHMVRGEPVEPAAHWEPHLEAIERVFGRDGAVRIRASEIAQGMFFAGEVPERERLVMLATFEAERFFWVRWLGEHEALLDLALGRHGCSAGTRARLQPLLDLAADAGGSSCESVATAAWETRWHEAERQ